MSAPFVKMFYGTSTPVPEELGAGGVYFNTNNRNIYFTPDGTRGCIFNGNNTDTTYDVISKGYKIIETSVIDSTLKTGTYTLQTVVGLQEGMKYVSCTSETNAVGGSILSIDRSTNTITVDGYQNAPLNTTNSDTTNNKYNYLSIVGHTSLGDTTISHYNMSFNTTSNVIGRCSASFAEYGTCIGKYSFVTGNSTTASWCSNAQGYYSRAYGNVSSANNYKSIANGYASTAFGVESVANEWGQFVCGRYNSDTSTGILVVGSGNSASDRRNCFVAGRDASDNSYIQVGGVKLTATNLQDVHQGRIGTGLTSQEVGRQFICGKYNTNRWEANFIVGSGSSSSAKSNCFAAGVKDGKSTIWVGTNALTSSDVGALSSITSYSYYPYIEVQLYEFVDVSNANCVVRCLTYSVLQQATSVTPLQKVSVLRHYNNFEEDFYGIEVAKIIRSTNANKMNTAKKNHVFDAVWCYKYSGNVDYEYKYIGSSNTAPDMTATTYWDAQTSTISACNQVKTSTTGRVFVNSDTAAETFPWIAEYPPASMFTAYKTTWKIKVLGHAYESIK